MFSRPHRHFLAFAAILLLPITLAHAQEQSPVTPPHLTYTVLNDSVLFTDEAQRSGTQTETIRFTLFGYQDPAAKPGTETYNNETIYAFLEKDFEGVYNGRVTQVPGTTPFDPDFPDQTWTAIDDFGFRGGPVFPNDPVFNFDVTATASFTDGVMHHLYDQTFYFFNYLDSPDHPYALGEAVAHSTPVPEVPEPSSLATFSLVGLGVVGLLLRRRLRRV